MRVVLPSNASTSNYPDNSLAKYTVQLPQPLDLSKGQWEIGLSEIMFHHSWHNVKGAALTIVYQNGERENTFPYQMVTTKLTRV